MAHEKVEYYSKIDSSKFINYLKKIFLDLMNGNQEYPLSELYYECDKEDRTGRCGRLKKIPFFMYWLSSHVGGFRSRRNIQNALSGKAKLNSEEMEKVFNIIDKLASDPDLEQFFYGYSYQNINQIVFRYQKEKKALVERKYIESKAKKKALVEQKYIESKAKMARAVSESVISWAKSLPSLSKINIESYKQITELIREYLELKYDVIYDHIRTEGVVIQSEMLRGKRRFRNIDRRLFDRIISELEEEGLILTKILDRRTYLLYKKRRVVKNEKIKVP